MAFCKRCGKKIDDDASFCNYCGTRVTAVADTENIPVSTPVSTPVATPVSTTVSTHSTPVIQEEPAVQPNEPLKEALNKPIVNETAVSEAVVKKKRSKVPLIIVLIIIILAALFAVFWFILKPILFKEDDVIPHNLFNDGLLSAVSKENGKWGYINEKGKFVIETQFDAVNEFSDGYASVSVGGQWGVIDKTGTYTVSPQYEYISAFSQGVAVVVDFDTDDDGNDQYGLIDTNGDLLMPITYDEIGSDPYNGLGLSSADELFVVKSGEKYGYANIKGEIVINPSYDCASPFYEGYASVCRNEKYGFIDKIGNEVIKCQYDGTSNFSENLCVVSVGGKYGVINTKGKYVVNPKYERIISYQEGYAKFEKDDKWGYIDTKGKEVIPAKYELAHSFINGVGAVSIDGKIGLIDTEGNWISSKYDDMKRINYGLYAISKDDKWGIIDSTGKVLLEPTYDDIHGEVLTMRESISIMLEPIYDDILYSDYYGKRYAFEYGGKLGYLSENGNVCISNQFMINHDSDIGDEFYSDGYAIVYTDDKKMAIINSSGEILNNKKYYGLGGTYINYCQFKDCFNTIHRYDSDNLGITQPDKYCSQDNSETIYWGLRGEINDMTINGETITENVAGKHLVAEMIDCSDTSVTDPISKCVVDICSDFETKGWAAVFYYTETGEFVVLWAHDAIFDNVGAYSSKDGSLQEDLKGYCLSDIYLSQFK